MGIIAWIILGLLAGMVAKMLVPGTGPRRLTGTTLIGVAGALLGGFVATRVFDGDGAQGFFNLSILITVIRRFSGPPARLPPGHPARQRPVPWKQMAPPTPPPRRRTGRGKDGA